ncbi:MAG TPA: asparaginase [Candidatus Eisenbacteria bacterium]|nr:asparaginase [Candidatus Eisenbacteria bacterium]
MPASTAPTGPSQARPAALQARRDPLVRRVAPPVLVRQLRNGVEESVHRGDIVEVDVTGTVIRVLGDPEHIVNLRSCVKPFGVIALLEADGVRDFALEPPELAIMASSHSGEDLHVRTLQAMYRRIGVSQSALACGTEGMPLDALTAARLARDGERTSPIRHMCSGQHSVFLLLSRLGGWSTEGYWLDDHPAQVAYADAVARVFLTTRAKLRLGIDGCGVPTYAFPLSEVARAYAFLADPAGVPEEDPRTALVPAMTSVRDAMLAHPELVGGTRDRIDTSMMKALPGRLISKGGMEALRGLAIVPGARASRRIHRATGMAIKIEDGDGYDRGTWAASVEALHQAGALDGQRLRMLSRYHRPVSLDPHGRIGAEAIASFDLVPLGELVR